MSIIDRIGEAEHAAGGIIATRVVLGGRLCTSKEIAAHQKSNMAEERRRLRSELTATIVGPGAGSSSSISHIKDNSATNKVDTTQRTTRMTIETQGGNALLASRYLGQ